jgi:hypothetical protein
MLITKKILPTRRPQIFNDNAVIDAAVAAQNDKQDHWVKYLMDDLTSAIQKMGVRKLS